jgi:hypothetical protein
LAAVWRQGRAEVLGRLLSMRFGQQEGHGGRARAAVAKFVGYRPGDVDSVRRPGYSGRTTGIRTAARRIRGGEELGDAQGGKTLGVQEALSLLSAHMPFEEATDKLGRLLGIHTCTSEAEKHAEGWGDRLEEEWETEVEAVFEAQANVLPEAAPERLYVAVDACKTPLTDQWRETKIGRYTSRAVAMRRAWMKRDAPRM